MANINWAVPAQTFPLFSRLLSSPVYAYHVLLGLTVSVGGLTESLVSYMLADSISESFLSTTCSAHKC